MQCTPNTLWLPCGCRAHPERSPLHPQQHFVNRPLCSAPQAGQDHSWRCARWQVGTGTTAGRQVAGSRAPCCTMPRSVPRPAGCLMGGHWWGPSGGPSGGGACVGCGVRRHLHRPEPTHSHGSRQQQQQPPAAGGWRWVAPVLGSLWGRLQRSACIWLSATLPHAL